jgi:hypothetical protein
MAGACQVVAHHLVVQSRFLGCSAQLLASFRRGTEIHIWIDRGTHVIRRWESFFDLGR